MENRRNYGIDALRIVSMLMIVMLHVLSQGGVIESQDVLSIRYEVSWALKVLATCGVNCYGLISGYVGFGSRHKYSTLLLMWLQVLFYTIGITLVFQLLNPEVVSLADWIKAVMPIYTSRYWYFTAYVALFLFLPLLDEGIHHLTQNKLKQLILGLFLLLSLGQTVLAEPYGIETNAGYSTLWLGVLYIIGAYIRKYQVKMKKKNAVLGFFGVLLTTYTAKYLSDYMLTQNSAELIAMQLNLKEYISPTILFAGIFLLLMFKDLQLGKIGKKYISFLTPASFSVYLIHTHWLVWTNVLNCSFAWLTNFNPIIMVVLCLISVIFIFIVCVFIDYVRLFLFKIFKLKYVCNKIDEFLV